MNGRPHDYSRRRFLGQVTLTAGGLAVSGLAPASLLQAPAPAASLACVAGFTDPCGDWVLDDMCNAYPPYAFPVPAAVPHTRPSQLAAMGADWHWAA